MPQLEAWQKVLVDTLFVTTRHNRMGCTSCHQGKDEPMTMADAHTGVIANPSSNAIENCNQCHLTYPAKHQKSLHASLEGYKEVLRKRSGQTELSPELAAMFEAQCSGCHTSCGQCHVSRPTSVDGGFIAGHMFRRQPNMVQNCTACHGSRVGDEFRGLNAGVSADAHYNRGFQCRDCHTAEDVHNSQPSSKHRYDEVSEADCKNCHQIGDENTYHQVHADKLSCQVCHSQSYKNCYSCHVGTESRGLQQPSEMGFKIGRNPIKNAQRPYDFVVLRHVPVTPNSFDDWAPGQLTDFAALPTWKFATPHNIQKNTPQTADCTTSCHNNPAVFLTREDLQQLSEEEKAANERVVVDEIP